VSLLSAVPVADPGRRRDRVMLKGDPPSPVEPPPGCPFHPRCPSARPRCATERPSLDAIPGEPERLVACFYPGELLGARGQERQGST
jgi:peptide/nickel transport system ATP-binding protein